MKTILKVLGIAAGLYLSADIGMLLGSLTTLEVTNENVDVNNKLDRWAIEYVDSVEKIRNGIFKNPRKNCKSEDMRDFVKYCIKHGYSDSEIKEMIEKYYR